METLKTAMMYVKMRLAHLIDQNWLSWKNYQHQPLASKNKNKMINNSAFESHEMTSLNRWVKVIADFKSENWFFQVSFLILTNFYVCLGRKCAKSREHLHKIKKETIDNVVIFWAYLSQFYYYLIIVVYRIVDRFLWRAPSIKKLTLKPKEINYIITSATLRSISAVLRLKRNKLPLKTSLGMGID